MHPLAQLTQQTRREFLTTTANGIGMMALGSLLTQEGLLTPASAAASSSAITMNDPLLSKKPHFAPRAKNCICIFMEGAPSQMDLFDPKPKLNELNGQALP